MTRREPKLPPVAGTAHESKGVGEAVGKLYALMDARERRRFFLLLPAVTAMALLQVVGIASVLPFLAIVTDPTVIETNAVLAWAYEALGFASLNSFLVFAGLGALVLLIVGNGFTAFVEWLLLRYSWSLNHALSVKLLREYLAKPYVFFLDRNTAGLATNILSEVKQAVRGFVLAALQLITRGIVTLFILGLLVALYPMLALMTFGFLGVAYGVTFLIVSRGMAESGRLRSQADRARFQAASEALSGIKDIRILGRELGLHLRNWIIWHYTFGQATKFKFARAHTHIFYFTMDRTVFTFNDQLLRFPSARHTEYQDLRANPSGRLPDDVWDDFPRVCGTFKERAGFHGCQMPEALLMRIVQASSSPGETVLDPFVGSGTTAVAAQRLGRRYIGIDLSPEYAKHVRDRLAAARAVDEQQAGQDWPPLHEEMLAQLYRETKVIYDNLRPNEVALRVMATALSQRTGREYTWEQVRDRLDDMKANLRLPKLPNDTRFAPRDHVKETGKRYVRRVLRQRRRAV